MKSIEIQNLDQHLKPLQIGGISTPIEIATEEIRISKKTEFSNDVMVGSDLYLNGKNTSIFFSQGMEIDTNTTTNEIGFKTQFLHLNSNQFGEDRVSEDMESGLVLNASAGYDSWITFRHALTGAWRIGNDATDNVFKIESGNATLGTAPDLQLNAAGDVTSGKDIIAGRDVVATNDIAVAATKQINFDGIGGHTYITENSDDNMRFIVGGDTMANFDEGNDRITMAATKHTSALANGTEFSATDSAYAGMILGYTRIANDGTGGSDPYIAMDATLTVLQTVDASTNVSITFVAPPSGNVEIVFSCQLYASSKLVEFALSDNTTHNEISETHTYDAGAQSSDETDVNMTVVSWAVTGLTAGTSYTYYVSGAEASSGTTFIRHGRFRDSGTHFPPIIVKAIALPATIVTGG